MTGQHHVPRTPPHPPYQHQPPPPASYPYPPPPPGPSGSRGLTPLVAGLIALVIIGATAAGVVALTRGGDPEEAADTPTVVQDSGSQPSDAGTADSEPIDTQDSGAGEDTGTVDTGTQDTGTSDSGTGDSGSTPAAASAGSGPASMLESHFADIKAGKLSRAYGNLIAGEATTASESGWVQDARTDGLYDYDLDVDIEYAGSGKAIARVVTFRTEASGSGCFDWSGFWRVQQVDGQWRIAKSKLARDTASCG